MPHNNFSKTNSKKPSLVSGIARQCHTTPSIHQTRKKVLESLNQQKLVQN